MAKNKSNTTGLLLAGGALLLAGGALLYFKNRNKKETTSETKAIEDIGNNPAAQQAAALYKYLGVTSTFGKYSAWAYSNDEYGVYNTCLEVTNIKALSQKFAQLCNSSFSLNDAMTGGLYDSQYALAMQYLRAKKVVTTKETPITLSGGTALGIQTKTIPANTVLGAYISTTTLTTNGTSAQYYRFVNEATKSGEVVGLIKASDAQLVTP